MVAILGIITEFNPFHNGHRHFLHEAANSLDFEGTVCVMSGNFVQRGEPALCNKWIRTQMALDAGIDLIIELPFCFAVRSAYYFAKGALQLLDRAGVVTHLAFGSENGSLQELQAISKVIAHEDSTFRGTLQYHLNRGLSFPAARSLAVENQLQEVFPDVRTVLEQPNNILAIEYLKVLEQEALQITPFTVARRGSGYNSTELSNFASASAIRLSLFKNEKRERIAESMPASSLALLEKEICFGRAPISFDSLEQLILYKLRMTSREHLAEIYEITEGLENRIQKSAISSGTLEELRHAVKSKRYSLSRINRILLYSLLDLNAKQVQLYDDNGPLYLHILGFSSKGRKILQEMKDKSKIRILSRGQDIKDLYTNPNAPVASSMIKTDILASNIYTMLYPNPRYRCGNTDFTTSPIYHLTMGKS